MAKQFKANETAMRFHVKNVKKISKDILPDVTKRFVADTNDQFVPELTADLKNSAFIHSEFDDGIAIWQTPYARRRFFEGSITGVAFWTLENVARNKDVYKKMIIERLRRI